MPIDDPTDELLIEDLLGDDGDALETEYMPEGRTHRVSPRRRYERVLRCQALAESVPQPPAPGESIHVLSKADYDFWTWVPVLLDRIGHTRTLWCSTWTVSRQSVVELFEIWDAGQIGTVNFLTGLYFKRRESAVYAMLLNGIRTRGGRYRASKNHAKVLLLDNPDRDAYLTVVGSANLTGNPRVENYVITNDRELHRFHSGWMDEILSAK